MVEVFLPRVYVEELMLKKARFSFFINKECTERRIAPSSTILGFALNKTALTKLFGI